MRQFLFATIENFWLELSGYYPAALLYSEDHLRRSRFHLQSSVIETAIMYHLRIYSMHAAQSLVNLFMKRF